jgi:hypothetical protein
VGRDLVDPRHFARRHISGGVFRAVAGRSPARNPQGRSGKPMVLGGLEPRRDVKAAPHPLELSGIDQPADGGPRRPLGFEVAGPH